MNNVEMTQTHTYINTLGPSQCGSQRQICCLKFWAENVSTLCESQSRKGDFTKGPASSPDSSGHLQFTLI